MNYDVQEIAVACQRTMRRMDTVTNNVANSGTPGFKQEYLLFLEDAAKGGVATAAGQGARESVEIDFRIGMISRTGNLFDLALNGEGFFSVQTANGVAYTRKGDFTLDREGFLVTQSGDKVLGDGGPLRIDGRVVNFEHDGSVVVDGVSLGRLNIAGFKNMRGLKRGAGGYFQTEERATRIDAPALRQSYLEMSNVNVIKEMVGMIDIQRTLESYQKLMQTINDEDKQSTGRVGKLV